MIVSWGRGAKGKVERVVTCGMDELRVLLVEKPFRLQGTWAEWAAAGEERRRAAKSKLPWIIGGRCVLGGGSGRTLADVSSRSLVCLDIDDCAAAGLSGYGECEEDGGGCAGPVEDVVERLTTLGICGFVYETITSRIATAASGGGSDAGIKLRIMVPLAEDISADDYAFAARILARRLGLFALDDKSFRPAQIMYLPATFSGEDVLARLEVHGEPWDALDEIQAWPVGEDAPRFAGEEAWDRPTLPTGQRGGAVGGGGAGGRSEGIISAFIEKFDAMDALLRFCGDRYEDAGGGRLRRAGSASMGGVVRVDRGVYSHHSGDCVLAAPGDDGRVHAHNAFDAVRLVKGWTVNEMVAWAAELPEIRGGLDARVMGLLVDDDGVSCGADDNAAVMDGLEESVDAPGPSPTAWASGLARKNGRLLSTFSNVRLCMTNLMNLRFNEMTARVEVSGRPFTDRDVVRVRQLLEMKAGMEEISDRNVWHGATSVALENSYDPVKEWIESEAWDGVERLDHWLMDWTQCERNELNRWTGRLTMMALVVRQYEPGAKYDYAVVLKSGQGAGKDTLWSRLGGAFYRTMSVEMMMLNREAAENTRGGVVVDMTELGGLSKTESAVVKEYITRTIDRTRHAYDREVTEAPRRFILVGSTNQDDFLVDETGNRRFLVVSSPCDEQNPFRLPPAGREYQQLWAEALVLYRQAREIWPDGDLNLYLPRSLSEAAGKVAASHAMESEQDVFNQKVLEWVDSATQFRDEFRVGDILQSLGMRVDRSTVTRVGRALRKLKGWSKVKDELGMKYVKLI